MFATYNYPKMHCFFFLERKHSFIHQEERLVQQGRAKEAQDDFIKLMGGLDRAVSGAVGAWLLSRSV